MALVGPPPATVVDALPPGALSEELRRQIAGLMDDLRTWIDVERIAWGQRYAVATPCRMLPGVTTDAVASKRGALRWARENVDPIWRPLIDGALDGRARGFDPDNPPTPGSVATTRRFATWCEAMSRGHEHLWTGA